MSTAFTFGAQCRHYLYTPRNFLLKRSWQAQQPSLRLVLSCAMRLLAVYQSYMILKRWFVHCGLTSSNLIIPPASTKLIGAYTCITLSVCLSVDRIVSALYLQQYSSDPFHICTSYQATSEGVWRVMPVSKFNNLKFWRIFKICNFDFVIFWLGIQYDSMVWVIMRRRGVSSECRRSSYSQIHSMPLCLWFISGVCDFDIIWFWRRWLWKQIF